MRFLLGLLSGLIGMLAGWFGLAMLVLALSGPDRDGGLAMGAFFNIGPVGGIIGLVAGIWLFDRKGIVRDGVAPAPRTQISYPFAVTVLILTAGIAYWAWYELIRSPYLTHGDMTLALQFRLPPGMSLPADEKDIEIEVEEGSRHATAGPNALWRAHDGDRKVILASASLSYKTRHRVVSLTLPGMATQSWQIDLPGDPDPTSGYSPWRASNGTDAAKVEMNFHLTAER